MTGSSLCNSQNVRHSDLLPCTPCTIRTNYDRKSDSVAPAPCQRSNQPWLVALPEVLIGIRSFVTRTPYGSPQVRSPLRVAICGSRHFAFCKLHTSTLLPGNTTQMRDIAISRRGTHHATGFAADGFRAKVRQTFAVTIYQIGSAQ